MDPSRHLAMRRAHARIRHVCPRCGKVCYGNGYHLHKRACKARWLEDVCWCVHSRKQHRGDKHEGECPLCGCRGFEKRQAHE